MKLETAPQDVMIGDGFEQRDVAIGDVAFILDMFADKVYSNKERAVIRELACNAHDSHVMADWQPEVYRQLDDPTLLAITSLTTSKLFELAFMKAYKYSEKHVQAKEAIEKAFGGSL